ncbi:E3 ubiquitin-protein ligase znrf1 [Cyprinodon tularosa]|uniref:E3 ubiquitin-protein ligase znrf1 n=1 Tax=Cyprinodon tularosa TaxID=77115 RepID=UPI0018E1F058|nr:E3 ubiquitin-protein ligase znrf1 [Cyprinodon tularosa]
MGGKQSTAGRPRGAFPGVSSDDSAVPPSAHFGHYRPSGTMGLRSRSVSSVAGMGIEHSPAVPFGFYTPRGTDSERAGGGSGGTTAAPHGTGYQDTGGGGHHTDGVLYLGSRGSLADTLPLHIAPRWFSAHSGKICCTDTQSWIHSNSGYRKFFKGRRVKGAQNHWVAHS